MANALEVSSERPRGIRGTRAFLHLPALVALDQEVMRRKAAGEDKVDGVRINVNRSIVLRDLLDVWIDSGLTVAQMREKLS